MKTPLPAAAWFLWVVPVAVPVDGSCGWSQWMIPVDGSCAWFLLVVPVGGSCGWFLGMVPVDGYCAHPHASSQPGGREVAARLGTFLLLSGTFQHLIKEVMKRLSAAPAPPLHGSIHPLLTPQGPHCSWSLWTVCVCVKGSRGRVCVGVCGCVCVRVQL